MIQKHKLKAEDNKMSFRLLNSEIGNDHTSNF